MSDAAAHGSPGNAPSFNDRRTGRDRRAEPGATRRAPTPSRFARLTGIAGREIAIIVGALVAIVVALFLMRPIFAGQTKVAQAILRPGQPHVQTPNPTTGGPAPSYNPANPAPPGDTSTLARLMASPQFERDRKAFAADLVATGRMSQARADSVAFYAVRESYRDAIPPAVVFGVLLTENAQFISKAMSNVGAVGLMQVYPKIWLKELGARFGTDLASDSTNLKYGIYILKHYLKTDTTGAVTSAALAKGLLRYNGCVRGTNTPHCANYPVKVGRYVDQAANSICGDKGFFECIGRPFLAGLTGRSQASNPSSP